MSKVKLFLENKGHKNPKACVRKHAYAYACSRLVYISFMHAYAYTGMRMDAKVPKTIKDKFSALKLRLGTNPTSSRSRSKPLFFFNIKNHTWYIFKTYRKS